MVAVVQEPGTLFVTYFNYFHSIDFVAFNACIKWWFPYNFARAFTVHLFNSYGSDLDFQC